MRPLSICAEQNLRRYALSVSRGFMLNNDPASLKIPTRSIPATATGNQKTLDFLRGLAAIVVLLNHTRGAFYAGGERILANDPSLFDRVSVALLQLTSFGTEAVILFFVLSGFAMANSMSLSSNTAQFYLKRVVRIWPPYIAACLLAAGIGRLVGIDFNLLAALFYINPGVSDLTPQFWSLPYEVVFYALCPLILASRQRVHLVFGLASLGLIATAIFGGLTINPWPLFVLDFLGNELFLFACGAMAFYHLPRIPRISGKSFAFAIIVALAIAWLTRRWLGEVNVFSMLAIVSISVLAIVNVRVADRFNFGYFSYSLYLFHYALLVLIAAGFLRFGVVSRDITNPLAWMPVAAAVAGCCWVLYWCTERLANQWVSRIRRSRKFSSRATQT